jgi:hypothetical protein
VVLNSLLVGRSPKNGCGSNDDMLQNTNKKVNLEGVTKNINIFVSPSNMFDFSNHQLLDR